MAIPSTGAVSMSDIQAEFGGSNPISLSEYYGAASGVPSSGVISLSDFYGTSSFTAIFTGTQPYTSIQRGTTSSNVSASIRVQNNGDIYSDGTQTGPVLIGTWDDNGNVLGSDSELRFVVTTQNGNLYDNASTFQPLSSNRLITVYTTGAGFPGVGIVTGKIEIRPLGGGTTISADFSLDARIV